MRTASIERILDDLGLDDNAKTIVNDLIEYYKAASYTDVLTGTYNKRFLFEKLQSLSNYHACMIDINNFKHINDKIGHVKADIILREIAEILKNTIDDNGHVIRFGGDEFVLIIPEKNISFVEQTICKIIIQISDKYFSHEVHPTISYGIAKSDNISTVIDIIKKADDNMYDFRKKRSNCIANI